jgi:methylated-DNA-[protein]-cysteine S-methyltransferase
MHQVPIPTSDGTFVATFSEAGLARLEFPSDRKAARRQSPRLPEAVRPWLRATERALDRVLAGKTPTQLPPLDLSAGTNFQQAVWVALQHIPAGATRSYLEVARAVGAPKAARAVGQACGANPIPVLIPCHRVLAAGGRLGGFSGGLEWKRTLLRREGNVPSG